MKAAIILWTLILITGSVTAQIISPVIWTFSTQSTKNDIYEAVFGVDVHYYTDSVTFVQLVKLKRPIRQASTINRDRQGDGGVKLSGTVEFMACDATKCLPPDEVEFEVELK